MIIRRRRTEKKGGSALAKHRDDGRGIRKYARENAHDPPAVLDVFVEGGICDRIDNDLVRPHCFVARAYVRHDNRLHVIEMFHENLPSELLYLLYKK